MTASNAENGPKRRVHQGAWMRFQRQANLDNLKLVTLGYKQELNRAFSFCNTAGSGFCLMSAFLVADYYSVLGLTYGGPVALLWGWLVSAVSGMVVAACIGELMSAFPTSGGLYYFSYVLAPPRWRGFICWFTGWLNMLGQMLCSMAAEYCCATFLVTIISLHVSGPEEGPGWKPTLPQLACIYAALMYLHAAMCCISHRFTAWTLSFGMFSNLISPPAFMAVLLAIAPTKQSTTYAFTAWMDNSEFHGITSMGYVVLMSTLMGQWTLCVFDSSVHLCEETIQGDKMASWAMFSSVAVSGGMGFLILLVMNYCLQSVDSLFDPESVTGGRAMAQLVWDVFKAKYGTGFGALPILYLPLLVLFLCPICSLLANSRMVYAFSRDDALFGSRYLKQLSKNRLPVNGTFFMATIAVGFGILAIYYPQANYGLNAMMVIALNVAYLIPISLRLTHGAHGFIPGPFTLGKWSKPLCCYSVAWLITSTIAFCLPPSYPVTKATYNTAPVMLGSALVSAPFLWWLSSRWSSFGGPKPNLGQDHGHETFHPAADTMPHAVIPEDHSAPQHQISRISSVTKQGRASVPATGSRRPSDAGGHTSRHRTSTMTGAMEEAIQICEGRWDAVEQVLHSLPETARASDHHTLLHTNPAIKRILRKQVSKSATFSAGSQGDSVSQNQRFMLSSSTEEQPAPTERTSRWAATAVRAANASVSTLQTVSSDSGSGAVRQSPHKRPARPPPHTLAAELSLAMVQACNQPKSARMSMQL